MNPATQSCDRITKGPYDMSEAITGFITPSDLAKRCNTDPKTMRRFMRSLTDERANKGGRWAITPDVADAIVERFASRKALGAVTFTPNK